MLHQEGLIEDCTCDLEQVKHGYQGVGESQGQYEVEVVQAITQVKGGALDTIQGAVAPTKDIVLDEVPQGELQVER